MLRDELGRQKLAIQMLTRFLIENGVVDGRMELDSRTGRLRFPKK